MKIKIQLVLVITLLSSVVTTNAQKNNTFQSVVLDSTLTDQANAIVRSEEVIINIKSINTIIVKTKRVVTVLNKYGNKHADFMKDIAQR